MLLEISLTDTDYNLGLLQFNYFLPVKFGRYGVK